MLDTAPGLDALPFVRHGFTDRRGGVSVGPLASLNLALREGEVVQSLVENWGRVLRLLDPHATVDDLVLLDQVHGGEVVRVTQATGPLETAAAADGMVTDVPGLVLAIRTADCVPVLLAAPGIVGAAHAGWRGVAARVVPHTVAAMVELGADPMQIVAVVGPHIGLDAYEVGEEVVKGVVSSGVPRGVFVQRRSRPHVDLGAAVLHQLASVGVERAETLGRCTHADEAYYSHRREGALTGRQASVIGCVP